MSMNKQRTRKEPGRRSLGLRPRLMLVTWTSLIIALLVGGGFGAYLLVRDVQTAWRVRLAESGWGVARAIQDLLSHTR
jgi:hypothetical protein